MSELLAALQERQATLRRLLREAEHDAPDWVWDSLLRERVFSCADRLAALISLLGGNGATQLLTDVDRDVEVLASYLHDTRRANGAHEEGEWWFSASEDGESGDGEGG